MQPLNEAQAVRSASSNLPSVEAVNPGGRGSCSLQILVQAAGPPTSNLPTAHVCMQLSCGVQGGRPKNLVQAAVVSTEWFPVPYINMHLPVCQGKDIFCSNTLFCLHLAVEVRAPRPAEQQRHFVLEHAGLQATGSKSRSCIQLIEIGVMTARI